MQFSFGDNFGNSAAILSILSLLQTEIYGAYRWSSSTHHTFIVWPRTLPSKTYTTANIDVKCLHFSRNVMVSVGVSRMGKTRVVFIDPGAKVNNAYYCNISSSKRVCCLTSEQYVVITGGHCSRMERQRTPPGQRWTVCKKSISTSLNLTCGLQIALILIPWIMLFGCSSATSLPPTTIQDGGRTEASDSHRVAKTLTAFHW